MTERPFKSWPGGDDRAERDPRGPDPAARRRNGKKGGGARDMSGVCPVCGEGHSGDLPNHLRYHCEGGESA